tara:strand:- start:166564 stop:167541 length:978 start_codon:yes stop_codon:yes gene_type:complete
MEESNEKGNKLQTVTARLVTDKPVKKTPYQVKGVIMNQFADDSVTPLLNGQYRKEFLYPRVQVKILNEQIYIVGINEGADPVLSLSEKLNSLDFGNITFQVNDIDFDLKEDILILSNQPVRYRFISPWVALNPVTNKRYKELDNSGRIKYLSQLLTNNILFLGKEMGLNIDVKVYTWLSLSSLFPKPIGEKNWGSFYGGFKTNLILPSYIGLGNGITRGFGTIYGLFDSTGFSFDEESLVDEAKKSENYKPREKPRSSKYYKRIHKSNQKVSKNKSKNKNSVKNKTKNKKGNLQFSESIGDSTTSENSNEVNFNRFKYHKKQHNF